MMPFEPLPPIRLTAAERRWFNAWCVISLTVTVAAFVIGLLMS
jgi:uncharacterized membrane protein YidH (DUF202 family)